MVPLDRFSRQNARAVLRHGRTCSEVWRANLHWQTKRRSSFAQLQRWSRRQGGLSWTRFSSRTISLYSTMRVARFSSTRTFSTLTSTSNRRTFMIPGGACKIILLKENRDGFYKTFFHVLHFVADSSGHYMISQEVDLVVGDFNGTAWWCHSRDDNSYWWSFLLIVLCLRHWAPHRWWDLDPTRTTQQTSVDFSTSLALSVSGKLNMVHSLSFVKLFA